MPGCCFFRRPSLLRTWFGITTKSQLGLTNVKSPMEISADKGWLHPSIIHEMAVVHGLTPVFDASLPQFLLV